MQEVLAAIAGSVAGSGLTMFGLTARNARDRDQKARDSLIRITAALDGLTNQLEVLHTDIKAVHQELFKRVNLLEQQVARLEGHADRN